MGGGGGGGALSFSSCWPIGPLTIFTPQSLRAVRVLFSPMVSGRAGGRGGGGGGGGGWVGWRREIVFRAISRKL